MRQWIALFLVFLVAWSQVPHLAEMTYSATRNRACPVECRCKVCPGGAKCCCANKRGIKLLFAQSQCDQAEQRPFLLTGVVMTPTSEWESIPLPSLMFRGIALYEECPTKRTVAPRSPPPRVLL